MNPRSEGTDLSGITLLPRIGIAKEKVPKICLCFAKKNHQQSGRGDNNADKVYPAHKESAIGPHRQRDVRENPLDPTRIVKLQLKEEVQRSESCTTKSNSLLVCTTAGSDKN